MPGQGNLKISHNFAGETDYIVAVPKLTTAPLSDVVCTIDGVINQTKKVYPAPHSQASMLIEGLEPNWYFINFYRSADGVALGALILTIAGNAATGAVYNTITYMYIVDRGNDNTTPPGTGVLVWNDPVNGSNELRDERLNGKIYLIEIRGTGTLGSDEYNDRSDLGGGFDVTTGLMWEPEQRIFVHVAVPQDIIVTGGGGGGGGEVSDVVIINDDTDYDPSIHGGKLLVVDGIAATKKLTIANLATVGDSFFKLQTHAAGFFFGVQLDVGDTVKCRSMDLNVVWCGIGEEMTVLFKNNVMYLIKSPIGYDTLGQRIWGDKLELNTVFRDGTQRNQTDDKMLRLMQWIETMPGSYVISEGVGVGQWGYSQMVDGEATFPNKGKYARVDTGTPKIRVPDSRNRFIRALSSTVVDAADAERLSINPGGYQHDGNRAHKHTNAAEWYLFGLAGRGNLSSNNDAVRQESFNRTQDGLNNSGGVESRSKNEGLLPLLKI